MSNFKLPVLSIYYLAIVGPARSLEHTRVMLKEERGWQTFDFSHALAHTDTHAYTYVIALSHY